MRISFISSKGGTGKSSLCLIIGALLQRAGRSVSIDDRDPQGTAAHFSEVFGLSLGDQSADFILTDTGGHVDIQGKSGRSIANIIQTSDRVVLVCGKSACAVHGSADSAALIKKHLRKGSKAAICFNQVRAGTLVGQQDGGSLARLLHLPPLTNEIPLSAQIENCMVDGLGAIRGKVSDALMNLTLEIVS
jgi:MinD-like ATPase involved in chromosome partitioning or flagellar assembly